MIKWGGSAGAVKVPERTQKLLVPMRAGVTPVPIPNTMVKTCAADGTWLETARESRRVPTLWGCSSVGRAPALQAGGHEFESHHLHVSIEKCQAERYGCDAFMQEQT